MKKTELITQKAQDSPKVFPDLKLMEKEGVLEIKPGLISEAFPIKNLNERITTPLKLRPLGFTRSFGLNE